MDADRIATIRRAPDLVSRAAVIELLDALETAQAQAEVRRIAVKVCRDEVDRLINQITEAVYLLKCWIADYDNEMWPYPVDETRALLVRFSPNEETAEEKK